MGKCGEVALHSVSSYRNCEDDSLALTAVSPKAADFGVVVGDDHSYPSGVQCTDSGMC